MSVDRKTRGEISEAGNPDRWERAELEVIRPSSMMISVRIPAELAIELETYAAKRSLTLSDVVRLATEQLVKGTAPAPSYAVLGTTAASSLRLAGPTVSLHALTSGTWKNHEQGSGVVTTRSS